VSAAEENCHIAIQISFKLNKTYIFFRTHNSQFNRLAILIIKASLIFLDLLGYVEGRSAQVVLDLTLKLEESLLIMTWNDPSFRRGFQSFQSLSALEPGWVITVVLC
jgi:hypothetical protein